MGCPLVPMVALWLAALLLPALAPAQGQLINVSATRVVLRRARSPVMALFHREGGGAVVGLTAGSHAGAGAPCETPVSADLGASWSCGSDPSAAVPTLQLNGFAPPGMPGWWVKLADTLTAAPRGGYELTAQLFPFPTARSGASPGPVVASAIDGSAAMPAGPWECAGATPVPGAAGSLVLLLQRQVRAAEPWRGANVSATLYETHLLTGRYSTSPSPSNLSVAWRYGGLVASRDTIAGAAAAQAASPFPFYYASEPSIVSLASAPLSKPTELTLCAGARRF